MKAIFLGYRKWAIDVYDKIKKNPNISNNLPICTSIEDLINYNLSDYDLLITCGWSDEIGSDIAEKIQCIGVHCAELDRYSYGTPIQLQIIDGINLTKHRVFKFTAPEKSKRAHTHTREYSHEVDLDLSGGIEEIFFQMTATSVVLFNMFLNDYPNIKWSIWPEEKEVKIARVPSDSIISIDDLGNKNTEEIYNLARSLESPYPNLCIEDSKGFLFLEKVRYKKK